MKTKLLFFLVAVIAFSLTGCALKGDCKLHVYDDAKVLSAANQAALNNLFKGKVYNEVYLFTVPEKMSYAECMDYKSPSDSVSWLKRNSVFRVYYFPKMRWIRVSAAANRANDFDRKYSLPLYHTQHNAHGAKNPFKEIIYPTMQDISSLTAEPVSWLGPASSITSVVDWLNETFILPSNNLIHVVIFRIPLLISLVWVNFFNGVGWPIFFMILILIGLSLGKTFSQRHVWLYGLLYGPHLLALVCLIFFMVPSYDTMYLMHNFGFPEVAKILDASYMRAEASEHTWLGGIFFIILYIVHRVLSYYMVKDPLGGPTREQQVDKKSNTLSENAQGAILMFILAFLMPKYVVWAVCAYLLQQIICSDLLHQQVPQGAKVGSMAELKTIITLIVAYVTIMLWWWICHIDGIEVTYLWASKLLWSLNTSETAYVFIHIIANFSLIGFCALLIFVIVRFWKVYLDELAYKMAIGNRETDEPEDMVQYKMFKLMAWMVVMLVSMLLVVWDLGVFLAYWAPREEDPNIAHTRCVETFDTYYKNSNINNLEALEGACLYLDSIGVYESKSRFNGTKVYATKHESLRKKSEILYKIVDGKYQRAPKGSATKKKLLEKRNRLQTINSNIPQTP